MSGEGRRPDAADGIEDVEAGLSDLADALNCLRVAAACGEDDCSQSMGGALGVLSEAAGLLKGKAGAALAAAMGREAA